jgi:hypothetical protein
MSVEGGKRGEVQMRYFCGSAMTIEATANLASEAAGLTPMV